MNEFNFVVRIFIKRILFTDKQINLIFIIYI